MQNRAAVLHGVHDLRGVSDDAGTPLSVGIWACRKAGLQGGEHVLVTVAGPTGLLAMQAALASGGCRGDRDRPLPLDQARRGLQAGRQDPHSVKAMVVPAGATT